MLTILINAFPLWILLSSALAFFYPAALLWFNGTMITWGLGIIMLCMGLALKVEDFMRIVKYPRWVIVGVILHYTVMPFLGWSLGYIFFLPPDLAVGLILVACCPSGTASNVVNYLAKSNLALSVTLTAISTIVGVAMTPFLTSWLVASRVHVDALDLLLSTVQVIILPVAIGLLLTRLLPSVTRLVLPVAPLIGVLFIALIAGSVVASGRDELMEAGPRLFIAVGCLHSLGYLFGYLISWFFTKNRIVARTTSIEVGMQNSGLAVVLAKENFTSLPQAALPAAIASVFQSLISSVLAAIWRKKSLHRGLNEKNQ